jgi:hypothetical protein
LVKRWTSWKQVARHSDKEIREVFAEAKAAGWLPWGPLGHGWGQLRCGRGCQITVDSTPGSPSRHARRLRREMGKCPH